MPFSSASLRTALSALLLTCSFSVPASTSVSMPSYASSLIHKQCGTTSPRLLEMGDRYYDLDHERRKHLGSSTTTLPNPALLAALEARVYDAGQGSRTECKRSGDSLQPHTSSVTLHDIVRRTETGSHREHDLARRIVFQAYEYNEQLQRSRSESIVVPLSFATTETSSGLLINGHQRQRQVTPHGSYLREIELTALQVNDELLIEQSLFINGTLTQWNTWHLIPR